MGLQNQERMLMLAETFVNKSHDRHLKLSNAKISMSPPKCRSENTLEI